MRSSKQSHDICLGHGFFFWPLLDLGLLREFFRHACHAMPTAIPEKNTYPANIIYPFLPSDV